MSEFSLELSEEQEQLRDWVHQFSVDVVRPAAAEWDEREEFPYPIVQQAAEIGLYSWEFLAQGMLGDKTGLTMPVAIEELFWGDAGIGMAIMGSALAAAGIAASGTQEQVMEWVPQCYGDATDLKLGAFCASEPDAGSDVGGYRSRAIYDEATDEWVLNGTKAWITNGGIADIHVVSKCDRADANATITDLKGMLTLGVRAMNMGDGDWQMPVLATSAEAGEGIDGLLAAIDDHGAALEFAQLAQLLGREAGLHRSPAPEHV